MTDLEAIKQGIANKAYKEELLARAIEIYLCRHNKLAHREILEILDQIIENDVTQTIKEEKENNEPCF